MKKALGPTNPGLFEKKSIFSGEVTQKNPQKTRINQILTNEIKLRDPLYITDWAFSLDNR